MVAIVVFGLALRGAGPAPVPRHTAAVSTETTVAESPTESLSKTVDEVQTLAAAVRAGHGKAPSPEEWVHRRVVSAMDADIAAAVAALERNPGNVRASHIVHANLERQAQALRSLYVERTL